MFQNARARNTHVEATLNHSRAAQVEAGLEALGAAGVKCRRLIIDDGWMALDRDTDDALNLSGEILTAANSAGNAAEKMYDGPAARAQRKFAELVGAAYARYVERAPPNSAGVLLWRLAATTVLRAPLCHFFDESTDFTKALAWPPRPHAAKFGGEAGLAAFVRDVAKGTHGVAATAMLGLGGAWRGPDITKGPSGGFKFELLRAALRAAKESEIPNFKGSYLGRLPLVSADFWTSDHLSERSRSVHAFSRTRARGTPTLKRR